MILDIRKILLVLIVLLGIFALSSPSLAVVVDMIGNELGDIIDPDAKASSSSETRQTTSTKLAKQSSSGSSSSSNSNSRSGSESNPDSQQPCENHDDQAASSEMPKKDLYSDLKRYTSYYNNGIDEVPELVKKVAGNDVIVLEIATNTDGNLKIKAVTKDGVITEFHKVSTFSGIDSTVSVSSDEDSIRSLLSNNDPMGELSSSLNSGDIEIECKGFLKKAAISALKSVG